jgi:hypothetical protein
MLASADANRDAAIHARQRRCQRGGADRAQRTPRVRANGAHDPSAARPSKLICKFFPTGATTRPNKFSSHGLIYTATILRAIEQADAAMASRSRPPIPLKKIARGTLRPKHLSPRSALELASALRRAGPRLPVVRIEQNTAHQTSHAELISTFRQVAGSLIGARAGSTFRRAETQVPPAPLARCLERRTAAFANEVYDDGDRHHSAPRRAKKVLRILRK